MMLINFREQRIDNFIIPSFTLSKGELVIIRLPNGPLFRPFVVVLTKLLTGKTQSDPVELIAPLRYVEHFKESWFRHQFFPMTVGRYIAKYANQTNLLYKEVYAIDQITPQMKVQNLAGTQRLQLSLYTTLSWTRDIVFDLAGIDPQGGQVIYHFVKEMVKAEGAAVLLDWTDEFKDDCTRFIPATYLGEKIR
ncbi:hypothetical protein ACFQ4C_30465 [Larkinella insperata]|uniref:Uncharacterized protein n=1 Tax=Larkinella insperata TaxID=332158 RepID=A0ABW3QFU2_9BACT